MAILGHWRVEIMSWYYGWVCRQPVIASNIHIGYNQSITVPFDDVGSHTNMSAPLHCYTDKVGSDFGNSGSLGSSSSSQVKMMPWWHGWGCRQPLIASHIHNGHIWSDLAPFNNICSHKNPSLHSLQWWSWVRCWQFWCIVEWKRWHDIMVMALDHLVLLLTSISGHIQYFSTFWWYL